LSVGDQPVWQVRARPVACRLELSRSKGVAEFDVLGEISDQWVYGVVSSLTLGSGVDAYSPDTTTRQLPCQLEVLGRPVSFQQP